MTPTPPAPRHARWSWHRPAVRARWIQALAVLLLVAVAGWLLHNLRTNLAARGIQSGFDFLLQTAGFDISEHALDFDAADPLWRAFLMGALNTLRVAVPGIVLVTVFGAAVGIGRHAANPLVRGLCTAYTELFRNVPLLVQLLMWYALLLATLPEAAEPLRLPGGALLGKAGLALPWWQTDATGHTAWTVPEATGFAYEGGLMLSPEYLTVLVGVVCYTAAFVADVVRAGIAAVPAGQVEAAASIGLSRSQALRLVVLPQALRVIVPPLANQYLNLTKNSSLAVAVGYPDVVSIAGTALNQTGRAVECIAIVMAVYLLISLATAGFTNAWNRRVALHGR